MIGAEYTAAWGRYRVHREDLDQVVLADVRSPGTFVVVTREKLAREYELAAAAPVAHRDPKPENVISGRPEPSSAPRGPSARVELPAPVVSDPAGRPGPERLPPSGPWTPPRAKAETPETLGAPVPASSYHVPRASHETGLYWMPCIRRFEGEPHAWFVSAGAEVLCPACRSSERTSAAPAWSELPPPLDPATKASLERVAGELRAMFRPGQWGRPFVAGNGRELQDAAVTVSVAASAPAVEAPRAAPFLPDDDVEQLDQVVEDLAPFPPEPTCDDCGRRMRIYAVHDNGLRFCHACIALSDNLRERIARRAQGAAPPPPSRWRPRDEDSHQGNAKSEIGSFKRPPPAERAPAPTRSSTRELWPSYTSEVER